VLAAHSFFSLWRVPPCSPIGLLSLRRKTFHLFLVAMGPC